MIRGIIVVQRCMTMDARGAQEAIEAINFPAASVDRVICNSGLAYLQDTPAALRRYRAWLRPGGRRAPCLARVPISIRRRLHAVRLQAQWARKPWEAGARRTRVRLHGAGAHGPSGVCGARMQAV
jgi:hypothetical protein